MRTQAALLLLALSGLAGCHDSPSAGAGGDGVIPTPTTLCVSTECATKTVLLDIPGAENILFTPSGRLFVSGGENVYEITRPDGVWRAMPLSAAACNFTGLAQIGNVLYANCFSGQLYAAQLTAQPQLSLIHELGISAANGLSSGPNGELYAVNGPVGSALPDPKIVQLRLNPSNPLEVTEQVDWLATGELSFPNGIQRRNRTLYFTQSDVQDVAPGKLLGVEILADGSAGEPQTIGYFDAIPDDFGLAGDHFLLTDYAGGRLALMNAAGEIVQESQPASFNNPSAVKLGQPPLFSAGEILVTEKGVIGLPPTPGYGNVLSVLTPDP